MTSEHPSPFTEESLFAFTSMDEAVKVLGPADAHVRVLERAVPGVVLRPLGDAVRIQADAAAAATRVRHLLGELRAMARRGSRITPDLVDQVAQMTPPAGFSASSPLTGAAPIGVGTHSAARPSQVLTENILSTRGKNIRPKTANQQAYAQAIDENTIVFGLGPAGTGKTYLAMAKAVQALQRKEVSRIILTRPAVEAGEKLGYLPGSLSEKIDPYLRPLYDALHDMMDTDSIPKLMEAGSIEVAPLAFMRGRTLNDAFIILDEAQNTTADQMKMFLTRLGFGSKMVVTGDSTQNDLPNGMASGLSVVERILATVEDIEFIHLTPEDVVRHRLVSDIVSAYGQWDAAQPADYPAAAGATRSPEQRGPRR